MNSNSNARRILRDLVSIEAWYEEFTEDAPSSALTVDLAFREANFGGKETDKVQFTVRLKRAELSILPEKLGSISVDRKTVFRARRHSKGVIKTSNTATVTKGASLSGELGIGNTGVQGRAAASGSANIKKENTSTLEIEQKFSNIICEHHYGGGDVHCWTMYSNKPPAHLEGHVWDEPTHLMDLIHSNARTNQRIGSSVTLQVKCLRKDIDILDIQILDNQNQWSRFKRKQEEMKLRLAEQVIKDNLTDQGLNFDNLSRDHAELIIADIIAEEIKK